MADPNDASTRLAESWSGGPINISVKLSRSPAERVAALEAEVSRLQQEHAKLTREFEHAEGRRSDLVVELRECREELQRTARDFERADERWSDVAAELRKSQDENALLKRSLGILERTISEAEGR